MTSANVSLARHFPASRRLEDNAVVVTVVLAVAGAWLAEIVEVLTAVTVSDASGNPILIAQRSGIYYLAHGLSIVCVMAAGISSALSGGMRKLSVGTRAALVALFLSASIWAALAYKLEEALSTEIFGATGPFVWFALIFVVAGTNPHPWNALDKLVRVIALLTAALAVRQLASSGFTRYQGFTPYTGYTLILIWAGGWTLLSAVRMRGWSLFLRVIPFIALIMTSICSLSRAWTLLSLMLLAAFLVLRSRERGQAGRALVTIGGAIVLAGAIGALTMLALPDAMNAGIEAFTSRLDEDTRSSQYVAFFNVVPLTSLVLGSGPKGTWFWPGAGDFQYFDNGFLWMLFIGGIPTLASYIVVVLRPAFRLIGRLPSGPDAAPTILVLCWTLVMAGISTFALPGTSFANLMILLWAGRCHAQLMVLSARESSHRPALRDFSQTNYLQGGKWIKA